MDEFEGRARWSFSAWIAEACRRHGRTTSDIGRHLGWPREWLTLFRRGEFEISFEAAWRLVVLLGGDPGQLFATLTADAGRDLLGPTDDAA